MIAQKYIVAPFGKSYLNIHQDHIRIIKHMTSAPRENIRYLDLFGRFCDDNICVFKISNTLMFVDSSHLSVYGSKYALEGIEFHLE